MVRRILAEQSVSTASTLVLPEGARLLYVKGECDTSPTYDFDVIMYNYGVGTSGVVQTSVRYAGTPNGRRVDLFRDWPQIATRGSLNPTSAGQLTIVVGAGTAVTLRVYYNTA